MSSKWEKTFEVRVPLERLWQSFTNEREYGSILAWPDDDGNYADEPNKHQVVEFEHQKRISLQATPGRT